MLDCKSGKDWLAEPGKKMKEKQEIAKGLFSSLWK
jgi:hypothetical protein